MRPGVRGLCFALLGLLVADAAAAHEVRPGYLRLQEIDAHTWEVLFKVPARGERRLDLSVRLPAPCRTSEPVARLSGGGWIARWRATCEGGLVGREVVVDGLPATRTDVLARIERADGTAQAARLTPDAPGLGVSAAASRSQVLRTYLGLGVEHILLGFDHLLFVLALLFLVGSAPRLVGAVTAFTAAHSLTLLAATLGLVRVAQAPVEAAIALSLVLVAAEVLHASRGRPGLAAHRPWAAAFAFGLLHGLGFAGALREVGLPAQEIPLALACFNVGVELGQLAFLAAVFTGLAFAVRALALFGDRRAPDGFAVVALGARPAAGAIGVLAAFWLIQRTAAFFGA